MINDIPFDKSEFGTEIPPVPTHYQELVAEWGGNTDGMPNARIVAGTDTELLDWCALGWIPRYTQPEIEDFNYAVWNKPDGTKKILSPSEAVVIQKSKKFNGIILPITEKKVTDWLIPRYFVEIFRPAEYFGTKEAWEKVRMGQAEDGTIIDMMGEFPENGQYETWFCIEDLETDIAGRPVKSVFRGLDDGVMDFIREQIENAKLKSMLQIHQEKSLEQLAKNKKSEETLRTNVREKLRERIDRIVKTPSNIRK